MTKQDQALYAAYRDVNRAYTLLFNAVGALADAGLEPTLRDQWANETARIARELPKVGHFLFEEVERRTE